MRIEHPYHDPRWGKPARNEFRVPDLYEIIPLDSVTLPASAQA